MGWFGRTGSRKELIADLTKPEVQQAGAKRIEYETLQHCYRGNAYSGILWSVVEKRNATNDLQPSKVKYRMIRCDLMRYSDGMWQHKPMVEASHPYYYSCPKKYLRITEGSPAEVQCSAWREKVREYHETAAQKRLKKKQLAAKY